MKKLTEFEKQLLALTRKHLQNEKEFNELLEDSNVEPIDLKTKKSWFLGNFKIEEEIRRLLGEHYGAIGILDPLVRERLKTIRDMKSKTRERIIGILDSETATELGITKNQLQELLAGEEFRNIFGKSDNIRSLEFELNDEEEEKKRGRETLDEMIEYFCSIAGYSGDFDERRKAIGTIIVSNKPLPKTADIFLNELKKSFLLNQFGVAIGISRILLEIACQPFFDQIPKIEKDKLRQIDGEYGAKQKIREACDYRLRKNKIEMKRIRKLAIDRYSEASDILHGKMPSKTDKETLDFLKDVFCVIETLYS